RRGLHLDGFLDAADDGGEIHERSSGAFAVVAGCLREIPVFWHGIVLISLWGLEAFVGGRRVQLNEGMRGAALDFMDERRRQQPLLVEGGLVRVRGDALERHL